MELRDIDFKNLANSRGINIISVVREYIQMELLKRISQSPLKPYLVFKGGTALHLFYNMNRYSEDLDFSLSKEKKGKDILTELEELAKDTEITDSIVKRNTALLEIRFSYERRNLKMKMEINFNDITEGEIKTLYSIFSPRSFNIQVVKTEYLVGQKVRAFIERGKARDLFDLWFMMKTKMPFNFTIIAALTQIPLKSLIATIEQKIDRFSERQIITDLNPFIPLGQRKWTREKLISETGQLFRALTANITDLEDIL